jgi:hypothetical protein
MLRARRAVSIEGMSSGDRTIWTVYLVILEEAIKILDSLINL